MFKRETFSSKINPSPKELFTFVGYFFLPLLKDYVKTLGFLFLLYHYPAGVNFRRPRDLSGSVFWSVK